MLNFVGVTPRPKHHAKLTAKECSKLARSFGLDARVVSHRSYDSYVDVRYKEQDDAFQANYQKFNKALAYVADTCKVYTTRITN
jgi:hypothetical protein